MAPFDLLLSCQGPTSTTTGFEEGRVVDPLNYSHPVVLPLYYLGSVSRIIDRPIVVSLEYVVVVHSMLYDHPLVVEKPGCIEESAP